MSDRIAIVRDKRILQISPARELSEYRLLEIASRGNNQPQGAPHAS
jgi:hypothetical protein